VQAFIRGLAETGYTIGESVAIEYRWADGHYDRIPDMVDDLVRRVASLNRPGGNATGVTSLFGELAAKQVGLLRDLVPAATLIGFLVNPRNPITDRNVRDAPDAAQKLGEKIEIVHASSEAEIDAAFETLRGMRSALLVQPDAFLNNKRIVALASA
jgi:putative ABC transport system substrate-binding protein